MRATALVVWPIMSSVAIRRQRLPSVDSHADKSILTYTLTTHRSRRRTFDAAMRDPRWAHIAFIRLRSPEEVAGWLARLPSAAPVDRDHAAS